MARLTFSHVARLDFEKLPRDRDLLLAVRMCLERAAADPDQFTEPAPSPPHRPGRLLCAFRVMDSRQTEYAFSVPFARDSDEMRVTYFAFNTTEHYPMEADD